MKLLRHVKLRIQQMIQMSKRVRVDSKFLIVVFFMCLIPICISSFETGISLQGNMATIRTMFSSLFGYIIENISSNKVQDKENDKKDKIGFKVNKEEEQKSITNTKKIYNKLASNTKIDKKIQEDMGLAEDENSSTTEVRVLVIGHILILITISLIVGALMNVDQSNPSLILLKNTASACIGFLISATKTNINKL